MRLLLLPDDVLRVNVRSFLGTADALNVLEALDFKVPMQAPLGRKSRMDFLLAWTETRVNYSTNPKIAERVVSTLESFVSIGKDIIKLHSYDKYKIWKTQFLQTVDVNIELLQDQIKGTLYLPHLPCDDLSLALMIERFDKLKLALEKNETCKHRRGLA